MQDFRVLVLTPSTLSWTLHELVKAMEGGGGASHWVVTYSTPTLTGVGHQWTIPISRGTFRIGLASENHYTKYDI